jgi:hypothetical protein
VAISTGDRGGSSVAAGRSADTLAAPRRNLPVNLWAFAGALIMAFEAWVLIRWVTGPYFTRVPSGPSVPPTWMKVSLIAWQAASIPAALGLVLWFVVRPWVRERRLGGDALLVIAFCTMWFQDPVSSYGGHWFTYNSWMVNFGSWVNDIPGWMSYGRPGAMLSEPILFTPAAYVYIFVIVMLFGSWVMRKTRARFPRISNLSLILVCYAVMIAFDVVLEGVVWMPMGIFGYHGGAWALFADTYHKYPVSEGFSIGATFTIVACLRYFTNAKGQMLPERGADQVGGGQGRKALVRVLATIAAVQVAFFVTYNVPNFWVGLHSTAWPTDVQNRSYFTNGLCGAGTNRACPGPAVPLTRNDNSDPAGSGSAYVGPNGQLVVPPHTIVPSEVPFAGTKSK